MFSEQSSDAWRWYGRHSPRSIDWEAGRRVSANAEKRKISNNLETDIARLKGSWRTAIKTNMQAARTIRLLQTPADRRAAAFE